MPGLLLRSDLGKRPYRLRCRFKIGDHPRLEQVQKASAKAAEQFVKDMHVQGWEFVPKYGFDMRGPFPALKVIPLPKAPPQLTARQMAPLVAAGHKFRAAPLEGVQSVPLLGETDGWEYELRGVFTHKTILTELED